MIKRFMKWIESIQMAMLGFEEWTRIDDMKVDTMFHAYIKDIKGKEVYCEAYIRQDNRFPYWRRVIPKTEEELTYPIMVMYYKYKDESISNK